MSGLFLKSAPRVDIVTNAQAAWTRKFIIEDDESTAIDYTGSTFDLKVTARDANREPTGSVLLTLETGDGIAGTVASGEIEPTFPAQADSGLAPGEYVYQIRRLVSSAPVETVMVGLLDVVAGIS